MSDSQLGHEKTLTGFLPALAGANLIYGSGMMESGVVFDCGQLVIDMEIARMIRYAVGGFAVRDDTLLVEDIAAVGSGGDFLSAESTLRLMRTQSKPRLIDRSVYEEWTMNGAQDMYTRATARAREIIEEHRPEPLDADVAAQVRRIVAAADRDIAGSGGSATA